MRKAAPPPSGALNKFVHLLRRPFYRSRDLRYIDEDSDDEVVHQVGRPPSIYYNDDKRTKFYKRTKSRKTSSSSYPYPSYYSGNRRISSYKRAKRRSQRKVILDPTTSALLPNGGSDWSGSEPGTPSTIRSEQSFDTVSSASFYVSPFPDNY